MDVETELAIKSDALEEQIKAPKEIVTTEKSKDNPNQKIKSKRSSRARTPQIKQAEPSNLCSATNKIGDDVNGGEEKIKETNGEHVKVENGEKENLHKVDVVANDSETWKPQQIEALRESTSDAETGCLNKEKPVVSENTVGDNACTEADNKEKIKEDTVEMDPLVISDEVDPELQFLEENSDKDSGKGSPLLTRCVTRRSYTRNIPTPKTPKCVDQETDSEKNSIAGQPEDICNLPNEKCENLNESTDSLDTPNVSTKAEVGSDSTRLNFTEVYNSFTEQEQELNYLTNLRDKGLSARRPIRGTQDYRRTLLKNTQKKSDLNESFDQINSGVKRKNRSLTPEERKKFRGDSPGYRSFFASPLATIRNKLKRDISSSTPELLSYKVDGRNLHLDDDLDIEKIQETNEEEQKSWCTLM